MSDFRKQLEALPREDLLNIVKRQDIELYNQVHRIEWVFENKLRHLTWTDGTQVTGRPVTNEELALLVDEPFQPDPNMTDMGLSLDEQRQLHIAKDPVLWAKHFLNAHPRAYQIWMLRDPATRKVFRAGRRLGKTFALSVLLLHYSFTHRNGRCLVVAPMKSQVELIFRQILQLAKESSMVDNTISRRVSSPQYELGLTNGSTIKLFTSGIKSGGKADVVRGQEAHLIVLDELDYMHENDLESLYAMLQQTSEGQELKRLVGASTPTGLRSQFYKWCTDSRTGFKEFWFPSLVNPFWTKESEVEFRAQYTEMGYRHEIEADWGESAEGVYPKRYVDKAFQFDWNYGSDLRSARSFFVMGVDWDKYGAGTNIAVLEVCEDNYEDPIFQGKIRLQHREETIKEEYALTEAVNRIIKLNEIYRPRHIYVDRGFGEVQVEMLHKYGVEHPESGLRKTVKGISFSETIEVRDPATKQPTKKDLKPFMVDNLRQMLEAEQILFPASDDQYFSEDKSLYLQLISYVVARLTSTGRPVFEAAAGAADHIHDAIILACLAVTENYGDLMRMRYATRSHAVSNEAFLPMFSLSDTEMLQEKEERMVEEKWGSANNAPVFHKRTLTVNLRGSRGKIIRRAMF